MKLSRPFLRTLFFLCALGISLGAWIAKEEKSASADGTNWKLIKIIKASDWRGTDGGQTETITATANISGGTVLEVEDVLVKVDTAFVFAQLPDGGTGSIDAGGDDVFLDVGYSGATEAFAKDVNLKATGRTIGSGTTSVKPRVIVTKPLTVHMTYSGETDQLLMKHLTAGQARVFIKAGSINER
jgi:hypothetical protein